MESILRLISSGGSRNSARGGGNKYVAKGPQRSVMEHSGGILYIYILQTFIHEAPLRSTTD